MIEQDQIKIGKHINNLKKLKNEIQKNSLNSLKDCLKKDELVFYFAIKKDFNNIGIHKVEKILTVSCELLEAIKQYIMLIDWKIKQDIIRQIRSNIKKILKKWDIVESRLNFLANRINEFAKDIF